jgi:hypothetical protein
MQNFFRKNCRFSFRAVVLFGLLAGLLFSSGEGVRLFPFPAFENAQNEKSFLNRSERTGYQKNIFRFEKSEGSFSKLQRAAKDYWASFRLPQNLPVFKLAVVFQADFDFIPRVFQSRFVSQTPGSRAPPFS